MCPYREVVDDLMASSTRKISYGAQKIVRYLIETAHADIRTGDVLSFCDVEANILGSTYDFMNDFFLYFPVCLKWRLFDPKIAAWLLNPDHPPQTFAEVLNSVQLSLPEVQCI